MKEKNKGNKLKKVLLILLIVLVSVVSFAGIYVKDANTMKNVIPGYKIGSDLEGYRVVRFKIDDTKNTVYKNSKGEVVSNLTSEKAKDKDGKEVSITEENMSEYGYTKEEIPVNKDEDKTRENYLKAREIISKRLEQSKVSDYKVRQDLKDGSITLELRSDSNTDDIASNMLAQGKFEVKDSETKEVLLNNDDIKSVKSGVNGTTNYIDIQFDKEGTQKFKEITEKYVEKEDSSSSTTSSDSSETKKQVSLYVDDDSNAKLTTGFPTTITNGSWQLSIGSNSSTTTDSNKTNGSAEKQARYMAALLNNGKNPLVYTLDSNRYIQIPTNKDVAKIVLIAAGVVLIIMMLVLIVKFKSRGLLAVISHIGFNAILLILSRYTDVELGIGGLFALGLVQIINYILLLMMLRSDTKKAIVRFTYKIIPVYIISIVFTCNSFLPIYSFGIVIFWAITTAVIYNYVITRNMIEE